jgi:hypothetical protein
MDGQSLAPPNICHFPIPQRDYPSSDLQIQIFDGGVSEDEQSIRGEQTEQHGDRLLPSESPGNRGSSEDNGGEKAELGAEGLPVLDAVATKAV